MEKINKVTRPTVITISNYSSYMVHYRRISDAVVALVQ